MYFSGINQEDLQKALEESKRLIEDDDGSLQAALALSLQGRILPVFTLFIISSRNPMQHEIIEN